MRPHPTKTSVRSSALAALAGLLLLAGCGSEPTPEELNEFDLAPAPRMLSEIDFGMYVVPVPGRPPNDLQAPNHNYLQLQFTLFGIVAPEDADRTTKLAMRHRGELRDRVISVCRNTSLKELQDPSLATLKLRLTDATQPVFEGVVFDTLVMRDLRIEAL